MGQKNKYNFRGDGEKYPVFNDVCVCKGERRKGWSALYMEGSQINGFSTGAGGEAKLRRS